MSLLCNRLLLECSKPRSNVMMVFSSQSNNFSRSITTTSAAESPASVANAASSNNSNSNNNTKKQQRKYGEMCTTLNSETPYALVFLRHGQSTWNRDNRFIGWTDTPLTDDGVLEARVAGQMLKRSGIMFDEVHTSMLRRSIRTTNLVLMEMGQEYIPVHKHWRLNERSYGDLVGKNKKEVVMKFGKDQVKRWRRSYDEPPPPMAEDHPFHPNRDPRYGHMLHEIPLSESLKDTKERSGVYWDEILAPQLQEGKTLLVVGHENNLRSIIMHLEDISKKDIIDLSLPRAVPLAYRLDENLKPMDRLDGKFDEATGFLRGEWLGGDSAVKQILDRDHKQVYDTSIQKNLETCEKDNDHWRTWMEFVVGQPSPYQKNMGGGDDSLLSGRVQNGSHKESLNSLVSSPPVPGPDKDPRTPDPVFENEEFHSSAKRSHAA